MPPLGRKLQAKSVLKTLSLRPLEPEPGTAGRAGPIPCQLWLGFCGTLAAMLLDGRLCTAGRILAGLSQAELAAKASLAVSVVARFEQGLTRPRSGTLQALVAVLEAHGVEVLGPTDRHEGGLGLVKGTWIVRGPHRGGPA